MENQKGNWLASKWVRGVAGLFGLMVLLLVYITQRSAYWIFTDNSTYQFVFSRVVRLTVNDFACLLIIWSLFMRADFMRVAWALFIAELVVILPIYLLIKLSLEGPTEISSPLLSQIHRLIVNPVLMILLIGGFFLQKFRR